MVFCTVKMKLNVIVSFLRHCHGSSVTMVASIHHLHTCCQHLHQLIPNLQNGLCHLESILLVLSTLCHTWLLHVLNRLGWRENMTTHKRVGLTLAIVLFCLIISMNKASSIMVCTIYKFHFKNTNIVSPYGPGHYETRAPKQWKLTN